MINAIIIMVCYVSVGYLLCSIKIKIPFIKEKKKEPSYKVTVYNREINQDSINVAKICVTELQKDINYELN